MIHYSDNWIYVLQIHSFFVSNDLIMKLRMIVFFEILVYNDKIGSMRKEFFYSVDNANLLTWTAHIDTSIVISFKNISMVLIIPYSLIKVFELSISDMHSE